MRFAGETNARFTGAMAAEGNVSISNLTRGASTVKLHVWEAPKKPRPKNL